MMMKSISKGFPDLEVQDETICVGFQNGKVHHIPYFESKFRARQPLELIHSKVFGPMKQPSIEGAWYMATFMDDYSRYVWVYCTKET